jgi:hypothetical protein
MNLLTKLVTFFVALLVGWTLAALVVTGFTLWNALCLMLIWNWFMPVIFNLPAIPYLGAVAVCIIVEFAKPATTYGRVAKLSDQERYQLLATNAVVPGFTLFVGFLVKILFM